MTTLELVQYRPGDYDQLIRIWDQSGLAYKPEGRDSREKIEKEVLSNNNCFLFARIDSIYVGSVIGTHDGRKGWINRVAVLSEFRNQGIGKKLVQAIERWLDQQGIEIYACQIESHNKESFEVFQKMGYVPFEGMHYLTKRKYPEV